MRNLLRPFLGMIKYVRTQVDLVTMNVCRDTIERKEDPFRHHASPESPTNYYERVRAETPFPRAIQDLIPKTLDFENHRQKQ